MDATETWLRQMKKIVDDGRDCNDTLELLSSSLSFDMREPVVQNDSRKLSLKFMFAEALYIITGRSDVSMLEPYVPKFGDYSDMYPFQQGSYGVPFIEQIRYVVETLRENPSSRQAVMSIWRQNPRKSKDIPCTLSLQFLIRDNTIHTVVSMRSSDAFTGLIYDMFCFTAMTAVVRSYLAEPHTIGMGTCHITAGSSHLYKKDYARIGKLVPQPASGVPFIFATSYDGIVEQLIDLLEPM